MKKSSSSAKRVVKSVPRPNKQTGQLTNADTEVFENQQLVIQNTIQETVEQRVSRLMMRLQSYGIDMFTAMKICTETQATSESGIWKILYDLNIAVKDGKVINAKNYLEKVLKDQYKI